MTREEQIKFFEAESRSLLGIEMEAHRRREQISEILDQLRDETVLAKIAKEKEKNVRRDN